MGEWVHKPLPVKSKRQRRAAVADAPVRRFANIDGKRVEVRQARPKEARPYPSAPVGARPGSRVAATMLRGNTDPGIPHLPFKADGPIRRVGQPLTKAHQANWLPFVPEFQAEGQPYPRIARDQDGRVMPRVRTDNGMTKQLEGRGIGRREDGRPTYTKRQVARRQQEREAQFAALMDQAHYRQVEQGYQESRRRAKQALADALGLERSALARGDLEAAQAARGEIRRLRKEAKYRG